jgi:hypothetical protein
LQIAIDRTPHQIGIRTRGTHARWGKILLRPNDYRPPVPTTPAAMIERLDLSSSNRTLSASSLKDRLSKLSVTPLRPVAALQARVKCVHSILSFFRPWPLTVTVNSYPPYAYSFVPASIPRVRRLQTVSVALWTNMIPICAALTLFLLCVPFPTLS